MGGQSHLFLSFFFLFFCLSFWIQVDASVCGDRKAFPIASEAPKWPHPSFAKEQRVEVKETIVINKPGTYDYSGKLHIWKGQDGGCEQKENGPQILRIEANDVVVKNFHYRGDKQDGSNGLGDPIHITTCGDGQGYQCKTPGPTNVVLDGVIGHACEDLLTVGTPGASNIVIKNSVFYANPNPKCVDKTLQFNFGKGLRIENNIFVGGERAIRLKPNTYVEVVGNTFYGVSAPIRITVLTVDFPGYMKPGPGSVVATKNNFINCRGALYTDDATGKITQSENKFTSCPEWMEGSVGTGGGKGNSTTPTGKNPKTKKPTGGSGDKTKKPTGGAGGKTKKPTGGSGGKTKKPTGGSGDKTKKPKTGGTTGEGSGKSKKPKTGESTGEGSGKSKKPKTGGSTGEGSGKSKKPKTGGSTGEGSGKSKKPKTGGSTGEGSGKSKKPKTGGSTGGSGTGKKPKTSGSGSTGGKKSKKESYFGH